MAALALIAPQACFACSCILRTLDEQAPEADAIFLGTVTDSTRLGGEGAVVAFRFEVDEVYAGVVNEVVAVRTEDNSAACGVEFEVGERYLVLATNFNSGFETTLCSGTAKVSDVQAADIASLGPAAAPLPGLSPHLVDITDGVPRQEPSVVTRPAALTQMRGWVPFAVAGLGFVAVALMAAIWRPRRDTAE